MKWRKAGIDALMIYGSSGRGDTDVLSDRDILLVAESNEELAAPVEQLSGEGFCCAPYTWEKLRHLCAKKALFIQHLKDEGVMLLDRNDRLKSFLDSFRAAADYGKEIAETRALCAITERFPGSRLGIGWALDVLAVAFRNLAILSMANEGRYIFSFHGLLDELEAMGRLSGDDLACLRRLRWYKECYRKRMLWALPGVEVVEATHTALDAVFDIDLHGSAVSHDRFVDHCLAGASNTDSWYARLRLCEGAFIAGMAGHDLVEQREVDAIYDAITSPACYTPLLCGSARSLESAVSRLVGRARRMAA